MATERKFLVRVPGSTSNLGSGFDTVSAALNLPLRITVEVTNSGTPLDWCFQGHVPSENIIESAIYRTCDWLDYRLPKLRISVDNPIPLKRGLGSSGAAIIGGIKIVEELSGNRMSPDQILQLAYPLEGHPDNLSASLLGGWVLSWADQGSISAVRLPSQLDVRFVVCIPRIEISTAEAREILPKAYSLEDIGFNLQRVALLVHAVTSGKTELLREATRDRIHQPFRSKLVPGMERLLDRKGSEEDWSLLSVTISGSGSTVLAQTDGDEIEIGEWMVGCFKSAGLDSSYHILDLDRFGAKVVRTEKSPVKS
jgi:homoserine kinase